MTPYPKRGLSTGEMMGMRWKVVCRGCGRKRGTRWPKACCLEARLLGEWNAFWTDAPLYTQLDTTAMALAFFLMTIVLFSCWMATGCGSRELEIWAGPLERGGVSVTECAALSILAADVDEAFRIERAYDWTQVAEWPDMFLTWDGIGITPTCGTFLIERMEFGP